MYNHRLYDFFWRNPLFFFEYSTNPPLIFCFMLNNGERGGVLISVAYFKITKIGKNQINLYQIFMTVRYIIQSHIIGEILVLRNI